MILGKLLKHFVRKKRRVIYLGRIRTKDIKNAAKETLKKNRDKFTTEFDANKKQLEQLGFKTSKRVRNKLAGYITRHKKIEMRG
jgi:small subunit ribosomal protein S17e